MTCYLQQGDCQKRCAHTADISGGDHGPPRQWKWEVVTTVLTFDGFLKGEEATKIYSTISSVPKNTPRASQTPKREFDVTILKGLAEKKVLIKWIKIHKLLRPNSDVSSHSLISWFSFGDLGTGPDFQGMAQGPKAGDLRLRPQRR